MCPPPLVFFVFVFHRPSIHPSIHPGTAGQAIWIPIQIRIQLQIQIQIQIQFPRNAQYVARLPHMFGICCRTEYAATNIRKQEETGSVYMYL